MISKNGVKIRLTDERWNHIVSQQCEVAGLSDEVVEAVYDAEADVLYINFKKPSYATDSKITGDDVIVRYENKKIIGLTILHAGKRKH